MKGLTHESAKFYTRQELFWANLLNSEPATFYCYGGVGGEVGSFGTFSNVSSSLSMLSILLSYWTLSRTTVQLPLLAGTMAGDMSDFICLRAFVSFAQD